MKGTQLCALLASALLIVASLALAARAAAEEVKPAAPTAEKAAPAAESPPAKPPEKAPDAAAAKPDTTAETPAAKPADEVEKPKDDIEEFIQKSKNPCPWFKWGADLRIRDEWLNDTLTFDDDAKGHDRNRLRYRPRWWGTVMPTDWLEFNGRICWEGRYQSRPTSLVDESWNDALWDQFNFRLKDVGKTGLSATIGRQDIILGDGWLVLDGTPLDGSRTLYFDAYRVTYEARPIQTTFDAIYIDNKAFPEDAWIDPLNSVGRPVIEQNEHGFIFWTANKSLPKTEIDGYYIYKDNQKVLDEATAPYLATMKKGDDGYINTFGARVAGEVFDHWGYRAEGAHEWGERNERTMSAFGFNSQLAYMFKDPMKNELRMQYEFLSGDDPKSRTNEAFDPLWGRWPQWSELWADHDAVEARPGENTNLHRLAWGWTVRPTAKMEFLLDYHLLWADEDTLGATKAGQKAGFSPDDKFRGQLLTALLKYKFTAHLSGHLLGEFFFPGDFYAGPMGDTAEFLRAELVFSY